MISKGEGEERKWRVIEERGEGEGPIPHLCLMMKAVTEKEENGEVLTEGVQPETDTDVGGRGAEVKRCRRAAEVETKKAKERVTQAESKRRRVKTGAEGGAREAERGSAPVHLSHLIAQGLISEATP